MRCKEDNGLYAVKLVPRPLPEFITESLLREITVRFGLLTLCFLMLLHYSITPVNV